MGDVGELGDADPHAVAGQSHVRVDVDCVLVTASVPGQQLLVHQVELDLGHCLRVDAHFESTKKYLEIAEKNI